MTGLQVLPLIVAMELVVGSLLQAAGGLTVAEACTIVRSLDSHAILAADHPLPMWRNWQTR